MRSKDSQVATQNLPSDHSAKPIQSSPPRTTLPPRSPPLTPVRPSPPSLPSSRSPPAASQLPSSSPSRPASSSGPVSASLSTPTSPSSQRQPSSNQPSIEIPNGQIVEQTPTPAVTPTSSSAPPITDSSTGSSSTRVADALRSPSQPQSSAPASAAASLAPDDVDEPYFDDGEDPIDMEIYSQILELDEDSPGFSMEMTEDYFNQAETTFCDMETALSARDLPKLSALGHYLKGSSAALGVFKVQKSCERIQHYGKNRDEEASRDLTDEEALSKIRRLIGRVKLEHAAAEKWLKNLQAAS